MDPESCGLSRSLPEPRSPRGSACTGGWVCPVYSFGAELVLVVKEPVHLRAALLESAAVPGSAAAAGGLGGALLGRLR